MITIVSGLPRAGTSLVMQMLHAGGLTIVADDRRPADDDNPRGYFEDARVKSLDRDASWLGEADGRALKVVSPMLKYLPKGFDYKVIFVERDLNEIVRSQLAMLARRGQPGAAVLPDELVRVFARHVAEVRALLAGRPEMQVLFVNHRALISDPRASAEHIRTFLGVPLDLDAMAAVADPALYRQRAQNG
jgi:hypothetical protein